MTLESAKEPAAPDRETCLVCGAATAWPETPYCFTHYQPEEPAEALEPVVAQEPTEALGTAQGTAQPAEAPEPMAAQEPAAAQELAEAPGTVQGTAQLAEAQPAEAAISKQYASQLHRELELGTTKGGRPLTEEVAQGHMAKLKRRALLLSARGRATELARISEVERRFLGHLGAAAESVNAHTTAALEPLLARAEGRVPARREGQTATERKQELDQALVASRLLREERRQLVEEERAEKRLLAEAKRAERAAKKARAT